MSERSRVKLLPSVEKILEDKSISQKINKINRGAVTNIVRNVISGYRQRLIDHSIEIKKRDELSGLIIKDALEELEMINSYAQRRVINATGVILHTNLGRSILSDEARDDIDSAVSGYVDLEMDVSTGKRTKRDRRAVRLLKLLTGVEDALVVNNNAAAVMLAVNTLAGEGAVAVSRGEMVEIGGSFRLPEILSAAAGKVIEIGTTNRTHPRDYKEAIDRGATLLLKVHTSNYRVVGYTNEVSLRELVDIGKEYNIPVMYDQGSGVLYPFQGEGIVGEDSLEKLLSTGVDLVSFSTDKVLGAVQGGVILGLSKLVSRIRENHLSRAVRVDKITLAGLERVLLHYWNGEFERIPTFAMMTESADSLMDRAKSFASRLKENIGKVCKIEVEWGESSIGGGSFPINPLRTALIAINVSPGYADILEKELRFEQPPVIVRVKGEKIYLDLRTVDGKDQEKLLRGLERAVKKIFNRE